MDNYKRILDKLNAFIAKFYTKMLLKGVLLFLTFGLLFFLTVLGIEYFFWLNSLGRLILFALFIGVEAYLVWKFILIPLAFLFKWKRGISSKEASLLIGKHFPEVDDKLYNLLDLAESNSRSELLLASIEQRSSNLGTISFVKAIDLKESMTYTKFLLVPLIVFGLIWISGDIASYFSSYKRVVNYDLAYDPPAPFSFKLLSSDLDVLDGKPMTVLVTTEGKVKPESMSIVVDGKEFLMYFKNGIYEYVFTPPLQRTPFYFIANGIKSATYALNVLDIPAMVDFEMVLDYPNYINRKGETIKSTGNAIFPEGTKVEWRIGTRSTEKVVFHSGDSLESFSKVGNLFSFTKRIFSDLEYELSTSNNNIKNHEKLGYRFKVIKDEYPTLKVDQVLDSLNPNVSYYVGEATDDYGLGNVKLVYYVRGEEEKQILMLSKPNLNYSTFYYTFPSGLDLVDGVTYDFYFEAVDNDAIHKGKVTKSQVFSSALLDDNQLKYEELQFQKSLLNNLNGSLKGAKEQQRNLKEIAKEQKENNGLRFSDQNKIKHFLKQQEEQEALMKKFSGQLKDNLKKTDKEDKLNKLLQERLERQELEAKKNEKLLEELQRISDKLNKEELAKRLEELAKRQQNSQRNLEQLLELTKRYYIQQKAAQLGSELQKLAKEQKALSNEKSERDVLSKKQQQMGSEFDRISEDLQELGKDNESLKKPMSLEVDKEKIEDVQQDQGDALKEMNKESLDNNSTEAAKKASDKTTSKQKAAAAKMKEIAGKLQKAGAAEGGGSAMAEDAEALRQVLDNLITFSFKQEGLYKNMAKGGFSENLYSGSLKKQQELKELFQHIDDSLLALSLRQAELSEFVNEQITEVYYNLDKTLESMGENEMYLGTSFQKYVLNASNSLSDFLANVLENMQQSMNPSSGKGKGTGFQLPDIIMGQKELGEKVGDMGNKGSKENNQGEADSPDGKGKDGKEKGAESGQNGNKSKDNEEKGSGHKSGSNGNRTAVSEEELNEIYQIYKDQQMLKEQLENQLKDLIDKDDRKLGEKLIKQMEDFQNDVLRNGITRASVEKMLNINREMLKLENAAMKQGRTEERESNRATDIFKNPILSKPSILENYRYDIEILNRQALPLQQNFQIKVKEYFKRDD